MLMVKEQIYIDSLRVALTYSILSSKVEEQFDQYDKLRTSASRS